MKTAVIFDLDGTLLNTLEDLKDSTNYALQKFGFPQRTLDEVRSSLGNGLRMLIVRAVPADTDDAVIDAVLKTMKLHYAENYHNKTRPYDGIEALLIRLKAEGYPMAIVSNKADLVVALLRKLYFDTLIPVAVGETEGVLRKPAPDMVIEGLRRLGLPGPKAVYVGDSEVDLQTARNVGIPCLSVTWGFRSIQQLKEAGAQHLAHTPDELYETISQLK